MMQHFSCTLFCQLLSIKKMLSFLPYQISTCLSAAKQDRKIIYDMAKINKISEKIIDNASHKPDFM